MGRRNESCPVVCLYVQSYPWSSAGGILIWGVARRSFGLLRHVLLLQLDPSASTPPARTPTTSSTSSTAWPPPPWTARRRPFGSRSLAVTRSATRTTAPPSSAARSPIPSRPAPPPASPSPSGPGVTHPCHL